MSLMLVLQSPGAPSGRFAKKRSITQNTPQNRPKNSGAHIRHDAAPDLALDDIGAEHGQVAKRCLDNHVL